MAENALRDLAVRCRQRDLVAIRLLHFSDGAPRPTDPDWTAFIDAAAPEFCTRIDRDIPKPRLVASDGIDFHRLHCLALDRLEELLDFLLPEGHEGATAGGRWSWNGHHPQRREMVQVCLLVGTWAEPNTGKSGRDLISLYGHMFGVSPGRAAHMLAEWLGAEIRAYA